MLAIEDRVVDFCNYPTCALTNPPNLNQSGSGVK